MATILPATTLSHTSTSLSTSPPNNGDTSTIIATFQEGSLGMSLEQAPNFGNIFIATIVERGQAHFNKISTNMIIVEVDHVSIVGWHLDEVHEMIVHSPRPLLMGLKHAGFVPTDQNAIHNEDEESSVLHNITFQERKPLGIKFEIDVANGNIVVVGVEALGHAEQNGMIPNISIIVSIGEEYVAGKTYDQVSNLLIETTRPLNIQFKNLYFNKKHQEMYTQMWNVGGSGGGGGGDSGNSGDSSGNTESNGYDLGDIIIATFQEGELGMSLEQDLDGYAIATSIAEGGQAQLNGIELYSSVVTVAGTHVHEIHFDDLINMIVAAPRPLEIAMQAPLQWESENVDAAVLDMQTSLAGEDTIGTITKAIFQTGGLGMSLEHDLDGYTIVTNIIEGGQAQLNRIELYSTVVTVGGKDVHAIHFDEVINMIVAAPRPLEIAMQAPLGMTELPVPPVSIAAAAVAAEYEGRHSSGSKTDVEEDVNIKQWNYEKVQAPIDFVRDIAIDKKSIASYQIKLKNTLRSAGKAKLIEMYNKLDKANTGHVPRIIFMKSFIELGCPKDIVHLIFDSILRENTGHLKLVEFLKWLEVDKSKNLNDSGNKDRSLSSLSKSTFSKLKSIFGRKKKRIKVVLQAKEIHDKSQESAAHHRYRMEKKAHSASMRLQARLGKKSKASFKVKVLKVQPKGLHESAAGDNARLAKRRQEKYKNMLANDCGTIEAAQKIQTDAAQHADQHRDRIKIKKNASISRLENRLQRRASNASGVRSGGGTESKTELTKLIPTSLTDDKVFVVGDKVIFQRSKGPQRATVVQIHAIDSNGCGMMSATITRSEQVKGYTIQMLKKNKMKFTTSEYIRSETHEDVVKSNVGSMLKSSLVSRINAAENKQETFESDLFAGRRLSM